VRRPLRLALVVLGLGAVVYGMACLTGGWLGTPPWRIQESVISHSFPQGPTVIWQERSLAPGLEAAIIAVGIALVEIAAWAPRRRVGLRPGGSLGRTLGFVLGSILSFGGFFLCTTWVIAFVKAISSDDLRLGTGLALVFLPVALCAALGSWLQFRMRRREDDPPPSRAADQAPDGGEDRRGTGRNDVGGL